MCIAVAIRIHVLLSFYGFYVLYWSSGTNKDKGKLQNHGWNSLDKVITTKIFGVASSRGAIYYTATENSIKHSNLLLHVLEINNIVMSSCVNIQHIICDGAYEEDVLNWGCYGDVRWGSDTEMLGSYIYPLNMINNTH